MPQFAPALTAALDRFWDLLQVIRAHYYHPGFGGSFSLKQTLPTLVPGMSYDGMAIADGGAAQAAYVYALTCEDDTERIMGTNLYRLYQEVLG